MMLGCMSLATQAAAHCLESYWCMSVFPSLARRPSTSSSVADQELSTCPSRKEFCPRVRTFGRWGGRSSPERVLPGSSVPRPGYTPKWKGRVSSHAKR